MSTAYGYGGAYSTTSSGAQGGAEGGGFMAGSQQGSQGSPSGGKFGNDTLRPVTIKQLINAKQPNPDGEFLIDGSEVSQCTFIGQIRNIIKQATNTTYKIDDGTGVIEVKQWVDAEAPQTESPLAEDAYCRVFGKLKSFNSKRHFGSHALRLVEDMNEVPMHMLEATYVHLYFTRGPPESLQGGGAGAKTEDSLFVQQDNYSAPPQKNLPNMTPLARKVLNFLNNAPNNNEGTNVQDIAASMGMQANEVFKAGDELLGMGIIYTTLDDETWAVLEQ